jgi:acetyl esterase/lipase
LAIDIIRPRAPNGIGIAYLVSGGWVSRTPGSVGLPMLSPLLRSGYTIFAVYHVSQPEATIMEIVEDMNRAVRFIRHHAGEYGIDPRHIGVTGGSAGGHLSLMLATRGGPGDPTAADPVDRESSAVQAVAIFYPPTDFLNLGPSTENPGDGGPPKSFVEAFGPGATDMAKWKVIGRDVSPIYHLTASLPPTLIYHGDADTLVSLDQSVRFRQRAAELGMADRVVLVVHHGGRHGWRTMVVDLLAFAKWFDRYLLQHR